jgi:biopolymer transport protein ExbD
MAKSKVLKTGPADMSFNMTPMIDCVFQLLIFFMLTTQMASADFVNMKVPTPDDSQARKPVEGNKAVVNVVPYTQSEITKDSTRKGLAKEYKLGSLVIATNNMEKLVTELKKAKRTSKDPKEFVVELRADQSIRYDHIEPVLQAMQQAELGKMYITAMREPQG